MFCVGPVDKSSIENLELFFGKSKDKKVHINTHIFSLLLPPQGSCAFSHLHQQVQPGSLTHCVGHEGKV